jgi:hypothetical protein
MEAGNTQLRITIAECESPLSAISAFPGDWSG